MKRCLNIGCGREIKESTEKIQWTNVDIYERENELDIIIDVTKSWPFEKNYYDFIYAEQFIEHLDWIEGRKFLINCFKSLKLGGKLRLVLPHYKKIFRKYIEGDNDFFEVFFKELNEGDLPYYNSVFMNPDKVRREREDNPSPSWHFSNHIKDRKRLALRVKPYIHNIEIVDWFCHQYGEHQTIYDFELLNEILRKIGYSSIVKTKKKEIDSDAPSRITSSLYIEAIK